MPEPQPTSPEEIVEALRRDLTRILERLPENAELPLTFTPLSAGEDQ